MQLARDEVVKDRVFKQRYPHRLYIALALVVAMCSLEAHADTGVRALRVGCSTDSDKIEIERFIAWSDENSPYPVFNAQRADEQGAVVDGTNIFYSYDFADREFIYALCNGKTRVIRIFVTNQKEITVTEQGRVIVDALPVGDA